MYEEWVWAGYAIQSAGNKQMSQVTEWLQRIEDQDNVPRERNC